MSKSFNYLNAVQFLDALNENLFKYIVAYYLIDVEGHESTSMIMAITGAVFILPFILLSSVGGVLADRWSKTKIIQATRLCQILFMALAFLFVLLKGGNWVYFVLFAVTSLSALFGPSKYGIIPEITRAQEMMRANGSVAAFTFFGIILGTAMASVLDTVFPGQYAWMVIACISISILGTFLSFRISETRPAQPDKIWPPFIYQEIFDSLKEMAQVRYLLLATFCYGYFLFIGAYVQMNIIPYSVITLGMKPAIGGYLFLFSSIGIGIGSLIATRSSGSLKSLPWMGLAMSVGCFLFTLFPHPFWINILWLIAIGVVGGLFLVPCQAYVLAHSRPENKGRNFGTANFFSFVFALLAAGVLYLFNSVIGLSPSVSFAWIGIVNILVCLGLFFHLRQKPANL